MKVLVTGGTGNVGSAVASSLLAKGTAVRALVRKPEDAKSAPAGAEVAIGDMLDPASLEQALAGVDKLFLVNGVVPDELTQALVLYGVARRSGIRHITYLSVHNVEQFRDVPHFASKLAVEGALRRFGVPFTILRPGYYMQNDLTYKSAILEKGIYPAPLGAAGICAVDIRDIAEVAALSLTEEGHAGQTYDLVGPFLISGPGNAALWSGLLGRKVRYGGHDLDQWEADMRAHAPGWSAFDIRMMFQGYLDRGFVGTDVQTERVAGLLGRPPRSYPDFAADTAREWKQ